jgi:filamentous hemagglutinin family protein
MRAKPLPFMCRTSFLLISCCILLSVCITASQAQVTLDGSLGPSGSLTGPNYTIPAEVGQLRGPNLFHSFGAFNVGTGESATFTGPDNIANVISRVTGGEISTIDGLLRSEVGRADFYLINPAGVTFGPNAQVDVPSGFHVGTADELHFEDGAVFSAVNPAASTLSVARPESFGFLSPQSVSITVNGSPLEFAPNSHVSMAAGNVTIKGGAKLGSDGGDIQITAVGASGHVVPLATGPFGSAGDGTIAITESSTIDMSGIQGSETVALHGGLLEIEKSVVAADHRGNEDSTGRILLEADSVRVMNSSIHAFVSGSGQGNDVEVRATDSITIEGSFTGIATTTFSETDAAGGTIVINSPTASLRLAAGGVLQSGSAGAGQAGDIRISVQELKMSGGAQIHSGIFGSGNAGTIEIDAAGAVTISASTLIADTLSLGNAGVISIDAAGPVVIDGSDLLADTLGLGNAGVINIDAAGPVTIGGSGLFVDTSSLGNAGVISIDAAGPITIGGSGLFADSDIDGPPADSRLGDAGSVSINAGSLSMVDSTITVKSDNRANAGTIQVMANEIHVDSTEDGSITFNASNIASLTPGSRLVVAEEGRSGSILLDASKIVFDHDAAVSIYTNAGDGGSVIIRADELSLLNGSQVSAAATGPGRPGDVKIDVTGTFLIEGGSPRLGLHGGIITSPGILDIPGTPIETGPTGAITIAAETLIVGQDGHILSDSFSNAPAGPITLNVGTLVVREGGEISSSAGAEGAGGDIIITAREAVLVHGVDPDLSTDSSEIVADASFLDKLTGGDSGSIRIVSPILILEQGGVLRAESGSRGVGGTIEVQVDDLVIQSGGEISTSTFGVGGGGKIRIVAESVSISQEGAESLDPLLQETGLFSRTSLDATGDAGTISVTAKTTMELLSGARISTGTNSAGNAGSITISAGELLIDSGMSDQQVSTITSRAEGTATGSVGAVKIAADSLMINRGEISITANQLLPANRLDSGPEGLIRVGAGKVHLDRGARITTESTGNAPASAVELRAGELLMEGESRITTESNKADGGDIQIATHNMVRLQDSQITTAVGSGEGKGGNITIDPEFVVLTNSQITADAFGGPGGNIDITAGVFLADPASQVTASSQQNIDGVINIQSPVTDITGVIAPPPATFVSTAALLRDRCAARLREGQLSSLVVSGREGMPARPGGVLPSPVFRADRERTGTPKQAEPLVETIASHPIGDEAPAQDMRQGWMAFQHGDFEQAVRHWQEAVRAFEREGEASQQSVALAHLAQAYQMLGHYQQALQNLQSAHALAAKSGDQVLEAFILGELGNVHIPLGSVKQASQYLHDGLRLAREMKADELVAIILNNRGNLSASQEAFGEALRDYRESARLAQLTGHHALTVRALTSAALITLRRGEPQEAKAFVDQAFPLLRALSHSHEKAYGLVSVGLIYAHLRDNLPTMAASLSQLALRSFDEALAVAQAIGDDRAASYAWGYLGNLYEGEGRYQDALELTRRAIFAVQHVQASEALYQWQWQTGRLLKALGQREAAMAAYRQALHTLQAIRHEMLVAYGEPLRFRKTVGPVYTEFVDLLLQPGAAEEALEEARQLLESLKIAELQNYFQDECVAALRLRDTSLDEVSQTAVVIYPILLPDRTELLVSLPTSAGQSKLQRFTVAIGADRITQAVRAFRQELENRTTRLYLRHAQQLYNWLIRPLEPTLASLAVTTLVFVPDGPLRTIPMAALHDGEQFLIQKYAVAITPGLNLTDPRPLPQPARVLAAGLTQSVQGFSPLPYVEKELQTIAKLYESDVLLNQDFQVSKFENSLDKGPFPIVHIASHGQFSGDLDHTFILTVDGKLTLDRLDQLLEPLRFRDEPIELLSLSACQTAAGDDRAALGLAGVAVRAGARSALATLWYINDQASSELVTEFYRQLRMPSVSRAMALQRAQIHLLDDPEYRHPAYWAPFLLINNWL